MSTQLTTNHFLAGAVTINANPRRLAAMDRKMQTIEMN